MLVMRQDDEAAAQRLKAAAKDKISAFAGCSGVGKSSALNKLSDTINMETGKISEKIARGRHTTRHVELLALDGGGYVLDTPGFSSVELPDMEPGELSACFPEFLAHENCRFRGCSHTSEPGCGVKEALAAGEIAPSRYENYLLFYSQLKEREAHRYD